MWSEIKNYFADFNGATNICRTIALWICIAFVIAFFASKIYVIVLGKTSKRYTADEVAKAGEILNRAWIVAALTLAVALIIAFAACYFVEVKSGDDYLMPILFYPLLTLAICIVASAIAVAAKPIKLVKIITGSVCGAALIAAVVCMIVYYASGNAGEALSNIGLNVSAIAIAAAVIVFAFLADRKSAPFDTRSITFAAVCVALSFALSYVRIFKMPMGGSITFASMLPIMLFAFMFGSRKGVLVGLIYGILQAIQDPWIIHPAQFALDYCVAFAAVGLAGCIRDLGTLKGNMHAQFAIGAIIACAFRFISHYFAGVFAFGMYGADFAEQYNMPALANEYLYSLVYQSMYLIPELIIALVVSMLALTSKNLRKQIDRFSYRRAAETVAPAPEKAPSDTSQSESETENAVPESETATIDTVAESDTNAVLASEPSTDALVDKPNK